MIHNNYIEFIYERSTGQTRCSPMISKRAPSEVWYTRLPTTTGISAHSENSRSYMYSNLSAYEMKQTNKQKYSKQKQKLSLLLIGVRQMVWEKTKGCVASLQGLNIKTYTENGERRNNSQLMGMGKGQEDWVAGRHGWSRGWWSPSHRESSDTIPTDWRKWVWTCSQALGRSCPGSNCRV